MNSDNTENNINNSSDENNEISNEISDKNTTKNVDENIKQNSGADDRQKKLAYYFKKIENYFSEKESYILTYKHIPFEEILKTAPKHYGVISLIERINILIGKDKNWLKHFIEKMNIKFDFVTYERWKSGKLESTYKFSETQSPSRWVHILQEYFIELLEFIQVLLVMEFYINEDDYKAFLKANPKIFFKLKANFIKPSLPSEDLEKIFEIIDMLLNVNISNNFPINPVIDTTLCIKIYRKIDDSKIFDLFKRKEFYIRYHLIYLKNTINYKGMEIIFSENVIKIGENFLKKIQDLKFLYKEYKTLLIEKHHHFIRKNTG